MGDKIDQLYDALKADGAVEKSRENFRSFMLAKGKQGYQNRKQLYEALKADGAVSSPTYEEFGKRLGLVAVKDVKASGQTKQQGPSTVRMQGKPEKMTTYPVPSAADEREPMQTYRVDALVTGAKEAPIPERQQAYKPTWRDEIKLRQALGNANSAIESAGAHTAAMKKRAEHTNPLRNDDVVKGDFKPNAETGAFEQTYITPQGDESFDRKGAEIEAAVDKAMYDESVLGQMARARAELAELQEQADRRGRLVQEQYEKEHSGYWSKVFEGAKVGRGMLTALPSAVLDSDAEFSALRTAIRQREEQIKTLEEQYSRETSGDGEFWSGVKDFGRGFGRTVGSLDTWDFGQGAMSDASAMVTATKNDRYKTEGQRAAEQKMMAALYEKETAEGRYSSGTLYGWGVMTGHMPAFMAEFYITGGGEAINTFGKLGAKAAVKAVGRQALKEMAGQGVKGYVRANGIKGAAKVAGKKVITALGTTADDLLLRAPMMTNTIQGARTAADIVDRKVGDVVANSDGTYNFENDKSWSSAVWQAEANSIVENASEMFGTHLEGFGKKMSNVFGPGRISRILSKTNAEGLQRMMEATGKQFRRLGVSDYIGETTEELYGQLLRTALNLDDAYMENADGTRTNLFATGKFYSDIYCGMAISMGMMGVGKHAMTGINYAHAKHQVNKAGRRAAAMFTEGEWDALKEKIDNASNDDIGKVLRDIGLDKTLTEEQKAATAEYVGAMMGMRGFNLADLARMRSAGVNQDAQNMSDAYMRGYNARDPRDRNDAKHMYEVMEERLRANFNGQEGMDADAAMAAIEADPVEALLNTPEQMRQPVIDYINAKMVYDGMIRSVQDNIEEEMAASDAMIDTRVHRQTGAIQSAVITNGDRAVYVINGELAVNDDGGIDHRGSDKSVLVRDAETGVLEFVDPYDMARADAPVDAEQQKIVARMQIRQKIAEEAANQIDGRLSFAAGEKYDLKLGDEITQVTVVGPAVDKQGAPVEGLVTVEFEDGSRTDIEQSTVQQMADDAARQRAIQNTQQGAAAEDTADDAAAEGGAPEAEQSAGGYKVDDTVKINVPGAGEMEATVTALPDSDGYMRVTTSQPIGGEVSHRLTPAELDALSGRATPNAEINDRADSAEQQENDTDNDPQPIGRGRFGNVYDVFRGKVRDAVNFLFKKRGGEAKGVFHRDELGEIDLIWGDNKGGLQHIINKHVIEQSDFDSVDAAIERISDIIGNGEIMDYDDRILIVKDGYRVVLARTEDGRFILTAYDNNRKVRDKKRNETDATKIRQRIYDGGMAHLVSPDSVSDSKDNANSTDKQENDAKSSLNESASALSKIPLDANGKPDFMAAESADVAWGALMEKTRDEASAKGFADNMVVRMQKMLQKAKQVKRMDTDDIDAFSESEGRRKAAIKEAEERLKKWQEIASTPQRRAEEAKRREEEARKAEQEQAERELQERNARGAEYLARRREEEAAEEAARKEATRKEQQDIEQRRAQAEAEAAEEASKPVNKKIAEVEGAFNQWMDDVREADMRDERTKARHEREDKAQGPAQYGRMYDNWGPPQSFDEWVVRSLSNPPRRVKWSGKGNMAAELYGRPDMSEKKDHRWMISDKNGVSFARFIHELWEGMLGDPNLPFNTREYTDQDVRNSVIEALFRNPTSRSLYERALEYQRHREENERLMEEGPVDEEYERDIWYQRNFHMTPQEYAEAEEQAYQELEDMQLSEEQLREYDEIIAEETALLIERQNQNGTEQTGETESGEGGSEVLHPEQAADRRGSAEAAEGGSAQAGGTRADNGAAAQAAEQVEAGADGNTTQQRIADAESRVNTEPTDAQKEAGNYKKGHVRIDGLEVTIEQPKGSVRRGRDADGKEWESTMRHTYGYIRGTEGKDGDHIDVFLSDNPEQGEVFVVDQYNPDGSFDEHKVMYGFASAEEARRAYLSNYEKGWENNRRIEVTGLSKDEFKKWIDSSKRKTKPAAEYARFRNREAGAEAFAGRLGDVMRSVMEAWPEPAMEQEQGKRVNRFEAPTEEQAMEATQQFEKLLGEATDEELLGIRDAFMAQVDRMGLSPQMAWTMRLCMEKAVPAERKRKLYEQRRARMIEENPAGGAEMLQRELNDVIAQINGELGTSYAPISAQTGWSVSEGALQRLDAMADEHLEKEAAKEFKLKLRQMLMARDRAGKQDDSPARLHAAEGARQTAEGRAVYEATKGMLEDAGIAVEEVSDEQAQAMLGDNNGARMNAAKRRALDTLTGGSAQQSKTAGSGQENHQGSVTTFDSAANIIKSLESLANKYDKITSASEKTIGGELSKALGLRNNGNHSNYGTFEAKNGTVVRIRISNHNAEVKNFDDAGFDNGISIVISRKANDGLTSNGSAHIVEYYYNGYKLAKAEGHPLAEIARSMKQVLYSGEYKDTTGLAERQEVNSPQFSIRTYHGTGADFEEFDFSYMGEGEGNQAFGWGGYVTEVKGIGRTYAEETSHNVVELSIDEYFERLNDYFEKNIGRHKGIAFELDMDGSFRFAPSVTDEALFDAYKEYMRQKGYDIEDMEEDLQSFRYELVHEIQCELEQEGERISNEKVRFLYTVDIPDDTGSNYLDWEESPSQEMLQGVLRELDDEDIDPEDFHFSSGESLYEWLTERTGSPREASELLSDAGLTGIRYPADYLNGGRSDGKKNYVIFQKSDMEITEQVQFLRTARGEVYGWTVGGKVFLNRDAMNPETPLHEYTHLWDAMVRKENPELWERGKELMKQTPAWKEVVEDPNYADIAADEDAVASEVHARLTGQQGAETMERMVEEARAEGAMKVAEAVTLREQLKEWLRDMFASLKSTLERWSGRDLSALTLEQFNAMPLRDLAAGMNPDTEIRRGEQARVVTEANPMLDDYHRGVRGRKDVMTFDEVLAEAEKAWDEYGDLTYPDMDIDMLRQAKEDGVITIYSSKPIEAGVFVTPSLMNAEDYAGGGRVYEKQVSVDEIAWTGEDEGQYAPGTVARHEEEQVQYSRGRRRVMQSHPSLFGMAGTQGSLMTELDTSVDFKRDHATENGPDIDAAEEANAAIDSYAQQLADGLQQMQQMQEQQDAEQEQVQQMEQVLTEAGARLEKQLQEYYRSQGSSQADAKAAARDMAAQVRAEVTLAMTQRSMGEQRRANAAATAEEVQKEAQAWQDSEAQPQRGAMKTAAGQTVEYESMGGLRTLQEGEFTHVERKFSQTGEFGFTGAERIESIDDVAYIFRSLEDYSKENAFAVLVKDGHPTVMHIGMGTINGTMADMQAVYAAVKAYGADKVYFVHNHPSGNLNPSTQDQQSHRKLDSMLGGGVLQESIIIDLRSGRYGVFDATDKGVREKKQSDGAMAPVKVRRFDRHVFSPDYDLNGVMTVRSAEDIAAFLSSHRLGERGKISFLILDNANHVVGNIHTPYQSYTDSLYDLAEQLVDDAVRFGGRSVVPYGNVKLDGIRHLADLIKRRGHEVQVLDALQVSNSLGYKSAYNAGLMGEENAEYEAAPAGKELTDGERLLAIQALEPIEIGHNNMSKSELQEVYRKLPTVKKDGREVEFYHSAFKKIYKNVGLFGQIVPALDEVLDQSVLAYSENDNLGGTVRPDGTVHKAHPNVDAFDNYVGKVALNGKEYYVRTTVQRSEKSTAGTHSFMVTQVDVYENTANGLSLPITTRARGTNDGIVDTKLQQFFERASSELNQREDEELMRDGAAGPKAMEKAWNSELTTAREAAAEQQRMRQEVTELAAEMGLDNVEILEDASTLTGRRRNAKGFYNRRTGKITVVLSNNRSVEDAKSTLLHEAVGHHGLRKLLGERFTQMLDSLYAKAPESVRRRIAQKAARMEWDFRTATEEYLAEMAEDGSFMEADRGWWNRMKRMLRSALRAAGIDVAVSDNEMRYLLWRSYRNLTESSQSMMGAAEDIAMQQDLKVGEFAEAAQATPRSQAEAARLRETNRRFNQQLEEYEAGNLPERHRFDLGMPSKYLQSAGFPNKPISMRKSLLEKKSALMRHPFSAKDIKGLVNALQKPLVIFSYSKENMRNVIVEVEKDGKQFLIGVTLDYKAGDVECNSISGIFPKENIEWLKWIQDGKAIRIDQKDKVQDIIDSQRTTNTVESERIGLNLDSAAKIVENFENPAIEEQNYNDEEDADVLLRQGEEMFGDSEQLQDRVLNAKIALAARFRSDMGALDAAVRGTNARLSDLRRSLTGQKEYDRARVKRLTDLVQTMMRHRMLQDMNAEEEQRVQSAISNALAMRDVNKAVEKLMDVMTSNQLRTGELMLQKLIKVAATKVDTKGMEAQALLDLRGQRVMEAFKQSYHLPAETFTREGELKGNCVAYLMQQARERLDSADDAIRSNAEAEYAGLALAYEYAQQIGESKEEEQEIRRQMQESGLAKREGRKEKDAHREFMEAAYERLRTVRMERAEAYREMAMRLKEVIAGGKERATAFRAAERDRIRDIQHDANRDMQGCPANAHRKDSAVQKWANTGLVRFFLKPLATFDQMLRMFGRNSVNGEGYLYDRFMNNGWLPAKERYYQGREAAMKELDDKVSEVMGRKMRWSGLYSMERKMPKHKVSIMDADGPNEILLTQGNLLYIYMTNKMEDGKMKLRKMGITEEDVAAIAKELDPRFVKLADWLQKEYLPKRRNGYNAVHERLTGAPMGAIENYFPLRVLSNARTENVDVGQPLNNAALPSTTTGSVIKRRTNSLPLDIANADAFSVTVEHVDEMERWAAFAEFNRDLNTLLSYKRFRNQVMGMASIYGGGKLLWNNFRDCCRIAAGTYRPRSDNDSIDGLFLNVAKGVTTAKITGRLYTALKQFLSFPAYFSEASTAEIFRSIFSKENPWRWAMEELPVFRERWLSRQSGDSRLKETDQDWRWWKTRLGEAVTRHGMSPNAFVDALTVSIGAHAIYKTKRKRYLKYGFSEEKAEEMAKRDATISFNQTQQSSEDAFMSAMQLDRTTASVAVTVFRNSSMGYQRQLMDSMRTLKRMMFEKGYRKKSIAFMTGKYRTMGLGEAQAQEAAEKEYARAKFREAARFAIFGFVMQFAWNLGGCMVYLLAGDDGDKKEDMLTDAAIHAAFGGLEGFTGGSLLSEAGNMWVQGKDFKNYDPELLPMLSDAKKIWQHFDDDAVAGANDLVNLLIQSGAGVNPQTITDVAVAMYDACNGDLGLAKESGLLIMRILAVPQSQIDALYLDEIKMSGAEAAKLSPQQLAERYAKYKRLRGAPLTSPLYSDEARGEREEKYAKRFLKMAKGRYKEGRRKDMEAYFNMWDEEYESTKAQIDSIRDAYANDLDAQEYALGEFAATGRYERSRRYDRVRKKIAALEKEWAKAKTPEEMQAVDARIAGIENELQKLMAGDENAAQTLATDYGLNMEVNAPRAQ